MKFEIELTEEEAKAVLCSSYSYKSEAGRVIAKHIREQLPKEKSWQERYKFLVGYMDTSPSACGLCLITPVKTSGYAHHMYGFTKEMFVRAVNRVYTEWRIACAGRTLAQIGERFLEKQEVEE